MERMHRTRYAGRGAELPCSLSASVSPVSKCSPTGSSLNPVLSGFLQRLHYTDMTDQITGHQ